MYGLTVSVGQTRNGLAGYSLSGTLTRLQSGFWPGLRPHLKDQQEKDMLPSSCVNGEFSYPRAGGLMASVLCHMGLFSIAAYFINAGEGREILGLARQKPQFLGVMDVTSFHLC